MKLSNIMSERSLWTISATRQQLSDMKAQTHNFLWQTMQNSHHQMPSRKHNELRILCRGVKILHLLTNPSITGYHSPPHFRILLPPPPPPPSPSTPLHLSDSLIVSNYITSVYIKACYDHMMMAIRECLFTYYLLHDLICVLPRVWGLQYNIVTSI